MYRGRFAPSPTGPLHLGSLVAAVGSYLRARQHQGQWLLRMEDLDPLREVAGAADNILHTLEAHGLFWDGEAVYQSQRHEYYQDALQTLINKKLAYACRCTRKALKQTAKTGEFGIIYPGTCRSLNHPFTGRHAMRLKTHNHLLCFNDGRLGEHCQRLESEVGDFIIKRSDGYFAYQLAVVVDDYLQGISEVVRGEDLLDNTQRQIYLQQLLGYTKPDYYHLPMVTNDQGQKLSKQTHAPALINTEASKNLIQALQLLKKVDIKPELEELRSEKPEHILNWAVNHCLL